MKLIGEVAKEAGISIRTLRYYDEKGILKPTNINSSGYRQYCENDIKKLQKILLLKEVGFSLLDIKKIIDNRDPNFENFFIKKQKEFLELKMERLADLIAMLESMLKGADSVHLEKFNENEINKAFDVMLEKIANTDEYGEYIQNNGGSLKAAKNSFKNSFMNYEGDLMNYMGDKKIAEVIQEAPNHEELEKSRKLLTKLYLELSNKRKENIDGEILGIIKNIRKVTVEMFPIGEQDKLFYDMAKLYSDNSDAKKVFDDLYGEGMADYYYHCVKEFYKRN